MKPPSVKQKLKALKDGCELPVTPRQLFHPSKVGQVPDVDERAVLNLAVAYHEARSSKVSVSWEAQEWAANYFNQHGLAATLDETFRLQAKPRPQKGETAQRSIDPVSLTNEDG